MSVGVFGGTFDPVHIGHLRSALELKKSLGLSEIRMILSAQPPHRDQPVTAAQHRLAMLQLALADEEGMIADDCELQRNGASYTIDTLRQIREELGNHEPLMLCIGMDALLDLNTWHRWRELLDYAHIVVTARPGWALPESGELQEFVQQHRAELEALSNCPNGKLAIVEMTLLPVSATAIRQSLQTGESVRYLMPDSVIEYIRREQLYGG